MTYVIILTVYFQQSVAVTTIGGFRTFEACTRQAETIRILYENNVTTAKTLCVGVYR